LPRIPRSGITVPFESSPHAAVAAELLEDEALVAGVLADVESSALDDRHKALFGSSTR
jgi:hypothetical protein